MENILLSDTHPPVAKIIDFGLSRSNVAKDQFLETRCGSEEYAPPEIIEGRPYDGKQSDAWSFGVIMYACLFGSLPFCPEESNRAKLGAMIVEGRYWLDETRISQSAALIIRRLLIKDPKYRMSIKDLQMHPYFV